MGDNTNPEYSSEWISITAGPNTAGSRVAIYEEDERHPDGQVLVYGDKVEQAYPTDEVMIRLREGFIKEVRGQRQQAQQNQQESQQETPAQKKAREKAEAEAKDNS